MKSIFLFLWFTFLSTVIHAMPVGMNPTQGYCQNVDPSACGWGGGSRQQTKVINIPSHYGAIALDGDKLILGSSENNLRSIRAARKEAVQDCINLGGSKTSCKVVVSTRNGCIALALGSNGKGGGISIGMARETSDLAEKEAMRECRESGGKKCYIAYSQCSRDPRYQVGR